MVNLFQTDDRVRPNGTEGKSPLPLPLGGELFRIPNIVIASAAVTAQVSRRD
jgi:hypothetical protein